MSQSAAELLGIADGTQRLEGVGGVGRRYPYDWALFHDWCAAVGRDQLPADPLTVALFLDENPAAPRTQVRRVTTINSMHRTHQQPAPGESEPVRARLNTVRRQRLSHLQTTLLPIIEQLPTHGWPAGVFGRRDAALLMFVALGCGYEQISRMRRGDVGIDPDTRALSVQGTNYQAAEWFPGPVGEVYERWADILSYTDRFVSTRMLATLLEQPRPLGQSRNAHSENETRVRELPLFVPIDRWGHLPLHPTPLTAASIAALVTGHLRGTPAPHPNPRRRTVDVAVDIDRVSPPEAPTLDPDAHDHGLKKRRHAQAALVDVGDVLDGVEDRAEHLLARLLVLLDDTQLD